MTEQEKAALVALCEAEIRHFERRFKVMPGAPVLKNALLIHKIALAALTSNLETTSAKLNYPEIPDGWRLVQVENDEVLVAIKRIEEYEDVDAQILAEDALNSPEIWPEWRVIEDDPELGGDAS